MIIFGTPASASHSAASSVSSSTAKAKKRLSFTISEELQQLSAASVTAAGSSADFSNKLTEIKKNGGNKRDFTTAYADGRVEQLKLERDRFAWEKETHAGKIAQEENARADEMQLKKDAMKEETRRAVMIEMVRAKCSAEEIKDFLSNLD